MKAMHSELLHLKYEQVQELSVFTENEPVFVPELTNLILHCDHFSS